MGYRTGDDEVLESCIFSFFVCLLVGSSLLLFTPMRTGERIDLRIVEYRSARWFYAAMLLTFVLSFAAFSTLCGVW